MAVLIIPTLPENGNYRIQAILDGNVFDLEFKYNSREDFWYINLNDSERNAIRQGIKLIAKFPLLRFVTDLARPAGEITMLDPTDKGVEADFNNIGIDVKPMYVEESELE